MIKSLKSGNNGFSHWFFQRISALIFLSLLIVVFFTNSVVFGCVGLLFIITHINSGLETLITDYMHDYLAKFYTEVILDVLIISLTKSILLMYILI
jgi:succinate dehydrogenase hydrophobic anchor subunit